MSLLQHPLKALDQVDRYLTNSTDDEFPGASIKSAGNLARQVLEQILLICAFFSNLPSKKYLRSDGRLQNAGSIIRGLRSTDPNTGRTYHAALRRQPPRIRKFAFGLQRLSKWLSQLNEPSHFRTPHARKRTRAEHIAAFSQAVRARCDPYDGDLLVAVANVLRSPRQLRVVFSTDSECRPGVARNVVIAPRHLVVEDGCVKLRVPDRRLEVLPANDDKLWRRDSMALVQHSPGPFIQATFVTRDGHAVDLRNLQTMLLSLARTPSSRRYLQRRLRKLGIDLKFAKARLQE